MEMLKKSRHVSILVFMAVFCSASVADELEVLENAVRSFQTVDPRTVKIYENSSNRFAMASTPARWRFYVQPVLAPERDSNGKLILVAANPFDITKKKPNGATYLVQTITVASRIWLIRPVDREAALTELNNVFAGAPKILPGMIDTLPVSEVIIAGGSTTRFQEQFSQGEFLSSTIPVSGLNNSIVARWQLAIPVSKKTKEERVKILLDNFAVYLETSGLVATPTFLVRTASTSSVKITGSKILDTSIVTNLKGTGDSIAVARFEQDKFSDAVAQNLRVEILRNPDAPINTRQILDLLFKRASSESLDEAGFRAKATSHMFDSEDIAPSKISHALNDFFVRDDTGKTWKRTASGQTSGGVNILDIVGVNASGQASFSDEGMERALHERGIKSDVTGKIIVVKAIDVSFVKTSQLAGSTAIIFEDTSLSSTNAKLTGVAFSLFERDFVSPPVGMLRPATAASGAAASQ